MARTIICKRCGQITLHKAHGLCNACVLKTRRQYFALYRGRDVYPNQRQQYDIRYIQEQAIRELKQGKIVKNENTP